MYLVRRNNIYYLCYFDEIEKKEKRVSTKQTLKKEALKFLADFKQNLLSKPKLKFITLSDYRNEYLEHVRATLSKGYAETVRVSLDLLIKSVGNKPIKDITISQMEKFITETFQRTRHGAKTYYIALKSAFNKAINWNYIQDNPLCRIPMPKVPKNNPLFITESEFDQLLKKETNPLMRDLFSFAFYTGARLGEIISLRWEAVSFSDRLIRIANTETD